MLYCYFLRLSLVILFLCSSPTYIHHKKKTQSLFYLEILWKKITIFDFDDRFNSILLLVGWLVGVVVLHLIYL